MAVVTEEKKPDARGIDPGELEQRVLVLRRFRTLLREQRDRFRSYLDVLDREKDVIETGTAGELLAHVELEEKIVADIFSIQKVINPLEDMYRSIRREGGQQAGREDDVPDLKAALEDLKSEALIRSGRNKELLSRRMLELRSEIKSLRSNPYAATKPAFSDMNTASLIDIKG
ncbi:MAG: flagellar biosynthesis protein FlgN [Treponema sp.]|jgi:hypothetical protein|nr:flagellar biosynthesis protein FlgN [Treponema sp.]